MYDKFDDTIIRGTTTIDDKKEKIYGSHGDSFPRK